MNPKANYLLGSHHDVSMQVHPPGNKHTILTSHADNEGSCIREEQGYGESPYLPLNFILIPKFKN